MSGFVYLWTNQINGKRYVGSHKGSVDDSYVGSGVYFKKAFKKNPENFKRKILYVGNDFIELEDFILQEYDVAKSKEFYNLKNQAVGGWDHTHKDIAARKKRSKAISKAKKGMDCSWMWYDKNGANNPMYGKKHSNKTKQTLSKLRKGKPSLGARKKVVELSSGLIFQKVDDAAEYYGIKPSTMCVLIRGQEIRRGKCKGKTFKYYDKNY